MKNYRKLVLIILIIGMLFILRDIYKEDNIRLIENGENTNHLNVLRNYKANEKIENLNNKTKNNVISNKRNIEEIYKIPESYMGFYVDCKLEIPKIKLSTYVFSKYSETAMNICPTKLCGPKPNENGNYSIIGHNYKKENMFHNLIDLKKDDEIYLIDSVKGKYRYIIYDIYKVKENNIDPIKQNKEKKSELTLITCVNYTNNRLIVKAKQE